MLQANAKEKVGHLVTEGGKYKVHLETRSQDPPALSLSRTLQVD